MNELNNRKNCYCARATSVILSEKTNPKIPEIYCGKHAL